MAWIVQKRRCNVSSSIEVADDWKYHGVYSKYKEANNIADSLEETKMNIDGEDFWQETRVICHDRRTKWGKDQLKIWTEEAYIYG
ncbi:hypothetical protein [Methanococcoides alaskense]|uniref:Uncharacterized protein n=1 Tax=Methanococcoides alaskense TaxID=325778 RepID=A0AA90TX77_9EURY|nr:hypothetical protein [Methanococcoides alaskense]MDA0525447.1 hypothetical protein [Methanococcoides alaskense]MDR6221620.1 hypothetical protein [Methanococcoides alaskense]